LTFRGNLLLYSLWYELHPFENLRRKGHHCHGLTHLSWAERKIFYRVLGKKFCGLFIYPGQSVRQVVAVSAPGDRDSYGCVAPAGMSRDPPQRRRARARNGVAPYIPAAFCRDAGSAGHGATRVARPFRSLQTRGFCVRDGSPPGRRQLRWLRSRQPAPPGDARESHKQERNGKKKRKNSNRHGNHRKITSEKNMPDTSQTGRVTGDASAWPASLPAGVSLPGGFARADRRPPPPAPVSPVSAAL